MLRNASLDILANKRHLAMRTHRPPATPDAQTRSSSNCWPRGWSTRRRATSPAARPPGIFPPCCRRARSGRTAAAVLLAPAAATAATTRTGRPRGAHLEQTTPRTPTSKPSTKRLRPCRASGLPRVEDEHVHHASGDLGIDHDNHPRRADLARLAKSIVFQWNRTAASSPSSTSAATARPTPGRAGDSRTGGHHILSLAEAMAPPRAAGGDHAGERRTRRRRGQRVAKVVNWLRAAAIVARIDPVQAGYLHADAAGHLRCRRSQSWVMST